MKFFFLNFTLGVNLFKDKDKSTQHQTEFFTGHITGSKFSMNMINFSQVDNQGKRYNSIK